MESKFGIQCSIAVTKFDELFLNHKRIILLKLIKEKGSINAASRELRMSYQQAWQFIREMNEISPLPLVVRQRGGVNGGGARLTEFGEKTIKEFEKLVDSFNALANKLDDRLWLCSF